MSEKDKLIERLIDKLTEAPIDYGDRPERMDPGHERNLAQKQTTFSDHPAMPEVDPNRVESDYPEVMASKRFRDVIQDVVRFTGLQTVPTGQNGLQILARTLMTALERILDLEDNHREDLEKLAIDLVKQEFGITDDDFQWDVKILDIRHPEQKEEMEKKIKQMGEEEQEEAAEEAIENLNDLELERYKRRFMNSMVQGAAQKMNQAYYLVQDRLNAIHPDLLNLYGTMMCVNDLQYWIMPDEMINGMAAEGSGAGEEEVDGQTEPPTIRARGINFPTLVHELTKGVMDAIASRGLPDDEGDAQEVMKTEDTLAKEAWDLRLGPIIWEKFRAAYPEELYQEDKKRVQAHLISEFAQLPADEFLQLAKEILSGSARGKRRIQEIVKGIIEELNKEELEDFEYNQDNEPQSSEGKLAPPDFDPTDPSTW